MKNRNINVFLIFNDNFDRDFMSNTFLIFTTEYFTTENNVSDRKRLLSIQ